MWVLLKILTILVYSPAIDSIQVWLRLLWISVRPYTCHGVEIFICSIVEWFHKIAHKIMTPFTTTSTLSTLLIIIIHTTIVCDYHLNNLNRFLMFNFSATRYYRRRKASFAPSLASVASGKYLFSCMDTINIPLQKIHQHQRFLILNFPDDYLSESLLQSPRSPSSHGITRNYCTDYNKGY